MSVALKSVEVRHILQHWKIIVTKIIDFVSLKTLINPVLKKEVKLHSSSCIVPNRDFTVLKYINLFQSYIAVLGNFSL